MNEGEGSFMGIIWDKDVESENGHEDKYFQLEGLVLHGT